MEITPSEFLHVPDRPSGAGLILTHGAGGNCRVPLLILLAEAFRAQGVTVLRYNLPFRQRRPFGPPSPATAAEDRAGLREAAIAMARFAGGPVLLGGHSYGGRQASMLAAEEPRIAAALLLLSYPLHPPGKPEQMRTAHLPNLRTPAVFVHGTKDEFGSIEEMQAALDLIPARTELIPIDHAGHDLRRGAFDTAGIAALAIRFCQHSAGSKP